MGTRKVLGMVGWYGMIDSPTPLLVADVVEYQYLDLRGSYCHSPSQAKSQLKPNQAWA